MIRSLPLALGALLLLGSIGDAAEVPRHVGRVNDYADVLSAEARVELENTLAAYEKETTHQVAVLTVKSLGGESIESLSLRVSNAWGLGRKGIDNGVLVTLAPVDHQVRIELGTGMNRYVSDSDVKDIIDVTMLPAFRKGDFPGGLRRGVARLLSACRAYQVAKPVAAEQRR